MPARADVVAIDGPAGSGKSTVARALAAELGFQYVDTGAMYRAVTLAALRRGADLANAEALGEVARSVSLEFRVDEDGSQRISLGGEDVSAAIRTPELTAEVRHVARAAPVREWMRVEQRRLGLAVPSVMEGRDIGTVVFPDAKWKFYLDATVAERARRRKVELEARGISLSDEQLAPLRCAENAEHVDTTERTIDGVVGHLARRVRGE